MARGHPHGCNAGIIRERMSMRTVQEYLKKIDDERLINEYLCEHPIHLHEVSDESMTIKEARALVKTKLQRYLERLRTMELEVSEDGKEYALFAHGVLKDGFQEEVYSLVCLQELIEKGEEAESYAYEFTRQAEIMGFLVSDAEFTQRHIYGLLVDVMFEASFFGFEQQRLEEEKKKLEEAIKECEEGRTVTYTLEEWEEEFGLEKEKPDETADELRRRALEASMEYDKYCRQKELRELKAYC